MRILAEFPAQIRRTKRYDWNLIFDGHIRELEHGTDFSCLPASLVKTVKSAAHRRGITVDVCAHARPENQRAVIIVKANLVT